MKKERFVKAFIFSLAVMFVLACSLFTGSGAPAEPAQQQQQQQESSPPVAPTDTPLPPPTKTPLPKPTDTPLPPTPAPMGQAVRSDSFEVTVVNARTLNRVYMGSYYYYPKEGQMFVELVVKVTNLTGSPASVPWKNVYVVESSGDSWYPNWAGFKAVKSGKTVDGAAIGVDDPGDGSKLIEFDQDVFLRAIWFVSKNSGKTELLFGFDDSPNIVIVVE